MKGKIKRNKSYFSKGHKSVRKGLQHDIDVKKCQMKRTYLRLKKQTHDKAVSVPRSVRHYMADGGLQQVSETHVLLRPQAQSQNVCPRNTKKEDSDRAEQDTYRLVHLQKLADMWNRCFQEHSASKPCCKGNLQWDSDTEQQRGLVWRANLVCDVCTYKSQMFNLFKEIETNKRGRKAAAINYGMQVELSQVAMGPAGLRKILLSGNIPAPSTKGMQNASNKVSEKIEHINKTDMADLRQELKTINKVRGHPYNEIDVECDGCYNNPPYSGINKTPFQPATQSCYVIVENLTEKKLVVNLITKKQTL